jgi:ATP-binding cassette subfamily B protein
MLKKVAQINLKVIKQSLAIIWEKDKKRVVVSILMLLSENAILFYVAKNLKKTLDLIATHSHELILYKDEISGYVLLGFFLGLFFIISKPIQSYYEELQSQKINRYVDDKIYKTCLSLNLDFFESPAYFDVLQRARSAGSSRINGIYYAIISIVRLSGNLMIVFWYIFTISPFVVPFLIIITIPMFYTKFNFSKKMAELNKQNAARQRRTGYLGNILSDAIHAKEVRSYNFGQYIFNKYAQLRDEMNDMSNVLNRRNKAREILSSIFLSLVWSLSFYFIIRSIIDGQNKVTDITFLLTILPMAMNTIQPFSSAVSTLYQNSLFVQYIFDLFNYKPTLQEVSDADAVPIPPSMQHLELQQVKFAYPGSGLVLNDVSIKLSRGKIIALVGLNGAGKSTILKLFSRLYDPTDGRICADGIDIRSIKTEDYRKRISVVFQDFAKYQLPIDENIYMGDVSEAMNRDRIIENVKLMKANQFIDHLPLGYDTPMGRLFEGGKDFSIGEWQKIAIARALYRPSDFIFLDEPTSALDAISEQNFFIDLKQSIGQRGALLISHKISAVKHADYIYILHQGKITEQGTHDELIAEGGLYHQLFNSSEHIWEQE